MLSLSRILRCCLVSVAILTFQATTLPYAQSMDPDVKLPLSSAQAYKAVGMVSPSSIGLRSKQLQRIRLTEVRGDVFIRRSGSSEWIKAKGGMKLLPADTIKTGERSAVEIRFEGRTTVRLTDHTELSVDQAFQSGKTKKTILKLQRGRLKAKVDWLKGDSEFKVVTPTAVASVRGTLFYLSASGVGEAIAKQLTDLYVDGGVVDFSPLSEPDAGQLVDRFGLTRVFGDGKSLPLRHLSQQERLNFISVFEDAYQLSGNSQYDTEGSGNDESEDDEGD